MGTKLELDTTLETSFLAVGLVGLILLIGAAAHGLSAGFAHFDKVSCGIGLAAVVGGLLGRLSISEYYVVDEGRQRLLFTRQWLGMEMSRPVAAFGDVRAVAVQGQERRSKYSRWWVYYVVVATNAGRLVRVTNEWRDLGPAAQEAKRVAGLLQAPVHPPEKERTLNGQLEYGPAPLDTSFLYACAAAIVVALVAVGVALLTNP